MTNRYDNPTKEFAEGTLRDKLTKKSSTEHGIFTGLPIFYRYVILDVVYDPQIIDQTKLDYWQNDLGVSNVQHAISAPRNSIIAKRVQSNNTTIAEQTMILYPFLPPNLAMPCQPGEHVWVMFEDPTATRNDLGYWFCRIVGPEFSEDVNHSHPHRAYDPSFFPGTRDGFNGNSQPKYEFRNGLVSEQDGERYTSAETSTLPENGEDAYKKLITDSEGSQLTTKEPVPRYRKRPGEVVLEGTNNSLIVLGRERNGTIATYVDDPKRGKVPSLPTIDDTIEGGGSIDLVAGRGQTVTTGGNTVSNELTNNEIKKGPNELVPDEGDPDRLNDRSRILISQRTRVDVNFGLDGFNGDVSIAPDAIDGDGAIVIKSDRVRVIARSDIELIVKGFTRSSNGTMVDNEDESKWGAIILKSNGDIVIKPSEAGVIKLGGDDANNAILCVDTPAMVTNGVVSAGQIISTMGGAINTHTPGQGTIAKKVLVTI